METAVALTGPKKRSWVDTSAGFFLNGPSIRRGFGCAEAGGKVYLFGGVSTAVSEHPCPALE